jgi:hypothetical protein
MSLSHPQTRLLHRLVVLNKVVDAVAVEAIVAQVVDEAKEVASRDRNIVTRIYGPLGS